MYDIIREEIMIEKYPIPVSIETTTKIINQAMKSICKIFSKEGKGTGFFCNIKYKNIKVPVMMTNNHVINKKYINENKSIYITLNDDKESKNIILD